MKKGDVMLLAQILHTMQDLTTKIEQAYENKNVVILEKAKKEMLKFQKQVKDLL